MNHGVIEQVGTPTEIYREPDTLFVADFIGAMNQIQGKVVSNQSVSVGNAELTSQPHELKESESATVAIRPEDIIPHEIEQTNSGGNIIEVKIEDMEFLGSFWRASLSNENLGESMLKADFSINAIRRLSIETGGSISVELPANRVWVFPQRSVS